MLPQNLPKTLTLRASSTPRITKCPGSMLVAAFETTSGAARLGTAIHEVCEQLVNGETTVVANTAAKHDVNEDELWRLSWAATNLWEQSKKFFPDAQTEVELSLNLPIFSGDGSEEKPRCNESLEVTGHADIISIPGDGRIRIGDWKSGWREGDYGAQLKTYALLAWKHFSGVDPVAIDRVIVTILWLRDGSTESETYSVEQLAAWAGTLIETAEAATRGSLRIGDQCHYCPVARCPAMQEKAGLFVLARESGEPLEITNDNAADLYFLAQALGKRVDDVKMALKQFVSGGGPIPASGGKMLDLRPTNRETIALTPESARVSQTQLSEAEMFAACDVNKTRLLDTVRSHAPKGEKTSAGNTMMDDLRSVGAVSVSVSQSLALVKPQLEEAE